MDDRIEIAIENIKAMPELLDWHIQTLKELTLPSNYEYDLHKINCDCEECQYFDRLELEDLKRVRG